jgi:hypothetical protein
MPPTGGARKPGLVRRLVSSSISGGLLRVHPVVGIEKAAAAGQ